MTRMQVQLHESQMKRLRELARREEISISEEIRRAVDLMLAEGDQMLAEGDQERHWRKERALSAVGRFASGVQDVSGNHDRYLEEAFDPR